MDRDTILCIISPQSSSFRSRMGTYIPNNHGLRCPSYTSLIVNSSPNVVEQKREKRFGFLFLHAYDAACNFPISASKLQSFRREILHPELINNAFSPVAGCVLTSGCSFFTGSLLTTPSSKSAPNPQIRPQQQHNQKTYHLYPWKTAPARTPNAPPSTHATSPSNSH
jgi:hypothetical protein